ncbi:CypX, Cytochrome P450 [Pyrenophora tritici-repentis]|uniref:CypX, Cytochrome P450 n=1 Tax=Pyrenophora tritici-repentis TaxID=45151 RepID=A0A316ZZT8_9PLEO|nr:CypX, Cytochrome P450 [Pyrenophora tritici-repentis]KAI0579097.1 Cytochrome P450 76C3 [Pyrenophora tritici-repentis]KAI1664282.1 Cytochrome P450 76C3 [Pyrenophora tritici-repentis]KAI1678373.1 Cytochrome P450 76C3 [Pyrenophora tritici-repentis]
MYTIILLSLFLATFVLYNRYKNRPPPGKKAAPGPAGLPILGNAHQLGKQPYQQITKWAREYGEVYKIRLGWNDWYMVCSPDACKEILDKQSAYTSSRAPFPVAGDALSGGMRFLFMEYGPEWRKLRGISHKLLTPAVSATFKPSQEFEAKMLLEEILKGADAEKGNDVSYMAIRRYTVSVIMTSTYGRRIPQWDCPEVHSIYEIMNDFSTIAKPGAYLADTLPFFGKLPPSLQWWRKGVKPYFDKQAKLWMSFWSALKTQKETRQAPECFVKQFMESGYEEQGISELQAAFLAGSMIEAGSETTSAALNTAILYLSANPDARKRAVNEIQEVITSSRSPTFDDEPKLPYIRAIVKETLRLRPVTNIGTPHYTTAPVTYKDIHIPVNSVVCLQQYPIHYDPTVFPEPQRFTPERYLHHPHGSGHYAAGPAASRDHWAFGSGRRICSGVHLAENSMFIVLAKLLWAFDILPPLDAHGKEAQVDTSDDSFDAVGSTTMAKPYGVRWRVRSEEIRETILREATEARRDGYVLRGVRVGEAGVDL